MKKILVVDGNSIINRAYYGMRPLTTKSGKVTHAVYGMINIISRQLTALKPDYAAVAFDVKAPTFRHEMYSEYKAGRHETPEDLLSQFPDAKECLALMGLHVLELPGYEADDIQGTVAKMAHSEDGIEAYVLSGDRDLLQLIDDKVTVLLATNSDTKNMDEAAFTAEYGISPSQFVDMKALMGDSSDNIPGVGGVGKKTAETLIQNFSTLDGIYAEIDDKRISKGVREKLIRDKDNAYMSRALAKINTEAPIGLTLEELRIKETDKPGLYKKFTELELNSLIAKFSLTESDEAPTTGDITSTESLYPEATAETVLSEIKTPVSVQLLNGIVYISDKNHSFSYSDSVQKIGKIFEKNDLICYDAKSLYHTLSKCGINLGETNFSDLSLYAYVLNPSGGVSSIEYLSSAFAGITPAQGAPVAHLFTKIEKAMREKIEADGLGKILFDIELPLIKVLAEIEEYGFKIAPDGFKEYSEALIGLAEELTTRIYMLAGREFNLNSPKQLGEVLFEDLGLPYKKKKTKTGYSTDAETLEELRPYSPIIDDILEYRQVTKLHGTYASVLPTVADESDRIHTDFKQTLTATGRLSSADPNLQNIPIRTKMGREIRRYFVSDEGYTLVDADYSQIELRLLAHVADDYTMKEAFINGEDIHRKTAAAVFGIPEDDVTEEMRKRAKAVNFGIVYGISGFSLSRDVGTSVAEATRYIKSYKMNYPSIEEYLDTVVKEAEADGYTTTVFGRRRYIPEINAQNGNMRAFGRRIAMNAPIQGAAADIMKIAMLKVANRLKAEKLDARIVMQVHDELVVEAKDEIVDFVKDILREEMENAVELSIPLTVDVTSGKNWLEQA